MLGLVDMPDDPSTLWRPRPSRVEAEGRLNVEETDGRRTWRALRRWRRRRRGRGLDVWVHGVERRQQRRRGVREAAAPSQRRLALDCRGGGDAAVSGGAADAEAAAEGCKKGKEGKLTTKRWDLVAERLGGGRSASSIQQHWDVMHGKHPRSKPKTDLAAVGIDPSLLSSPQVCMGTVVSHEGEVGVTLRVKPALPPPAAAAAALQAAKLAPGRGQASRGGGACACQGCGQGGGGGEQGE